MFNSKPETNNLAHQTRVGLVFISYVAFIEVLDLTCRSACGFAVESQVIDVFKPASVRRARNGISSYRAEEVHRCPLGVPTASANIFQSRYPKKHVHPRYLRRYIDF